ncbi:MAG: beta-ribofuranosylaminobenzene 5'-phosphate synthase family protein [Methylococcales bacterium]|jgi:beta-RFAP synthase
MDQYSKVSVFAPARLHMGFIDLSGSLDRHFGSIGIALNEHATRLSLTSGEKRVITGPSAERADKCLTLMCQALNVSDKLTVNIETAIPEHIGLGSGTQMSLAIGSALNAYYGLGLGVRDIAALMDRGLRSGIGIGIFERGGLVVDGGRGEKTITPPVIVHLDIPASWRFILVLDKRGQGLHGQQEIEAFKVLPPFPRHEVERLCYLLMMKGLPAVAENNIVDFGNVISQLQCSVGEHFAAAQGGVFTSPEVAVAMKWLAQQGAVAIGQTSWGPTGFCAIDGVSLAESITEEAVQKFSYFDNLSFVTASACNSGGDVFVT